MSPLQQQLQHFTPMLVGDPVGQLSQTYFIPWDAVLLWPLAILLLVLPLICLLQRHRAPITRARQLIPRLLSALLWLILPTSFVTVLAISAHYYWGGPFNHRHYRIPRHNADLVIWFTGADDGANTQHYWEGSIHRSAYQFGYQRTALFSFADVDQALLYVAQTPPKTRLIVRGHSMGAAAAMTFAQHSPREILLLDTRDPTSWCHRRHHKPPQVRFWRNVIPEITDLFAPRHLHPTTNYWGTLNMANLFRIMGNAWPQQPDAITVTVPGRDHHSVGNNLPDDPCIVPMEELIDSPESSL